MLQLIGANRLTLPLFQKLKAVHNQTEQVVVLGGTYTLLALLCGLWLGVPEEPVEAADNKTTPT